MSDSRIEAGLDVLSTISGSKEGGENLADFFASRGALGSIVHLTGVGEIWARNEFSRRDRSMVVISALTAMGREVELRQHIGGGLNHGLTRDEIDEIMVQLSAYVGAPFALGGAGVAAAVFAERDGTETRETPPAPLELKDPEKRRADGLEFLKTLLGQPDLDTKLTEHARNLGENARLVARRKPQIGTAHHLVQGDRRFRLDRLGLIRERRHGSRATFPLDLPRNLHQVAHWHTTSTPGRGLHPDLCCAGT